MTVISRPFTSVLLKERRKYQRDIQTHNQKENGNILAKQVI